MDWQPFIDCPCRRLGPIKCTALVSAKRPLMTSAPEELASPMNERRRYLLCNAKSNLFEPGLTSAVNALWRLYLAGSS